MESPNSSLDTFDDDFLESSLQKDSILSILDNDEVIYSFSSSSTNKNISIDMDNIIVNDSIPIEDVIARFTSRPQFPRCIDDRFDTDHKVVVVHQTSSKRRTFLKFLSKLRHK